MGVCGTRFIELKIDLYWHYLWRRERRRLSPLWKQLVMLGRGVRACSRFDRLTHHAHGHGGYIAAGGGVGSPFGGRAQADGRCRVGGVCSQVTRVSYHICLGVKYRRAYGTAIGSYAENIRRQHSKH